MSSKNKSTNIQINRLKVRGGGERRMCEVRLKCSLLLGRHKVINGLAFLQPFLHLDHQPDSIHHHLHQLHLREAQTVSVGDVKNTTHSCSVHTT